ncbi:MAG: phage minor head protein [Gemmatimonadales bacterium]
MAVDPTYQALPFQEAVAFLRAKVRLPSEVWEQLLREAHDWAFTVAGATKAEILAGLRDAVDKALADGATLAEFRKDFDQVVQKHGWSYRGKRGWRTAMIYRTNLSTAQNAGRYRQMTDPDILAAKPFWLYRHGDSLVPRPKHLEWDGTVLPADHAWWTTHYAPNGWGCSCRVFALSRDEVEARELTIRNHAPSGGTYEWADPISGEIREIPVGIDPGFDYAPGASLASDRERILAGVLKRLPADLRALAESEIQSAHNRDPEL